MINIQSHGFQKLDEILQNETVAAMMALSVSLLVITKLLILDVNSMMQTEF